MAVTQAATALTASVATLIYDGTTQAAAVDVSLVNRGSVVRRARLALAGLVAPASADWVEYDTALSPGVPVVNWSIIVPAGRRLFALVDGADCAAEVHGETIANATCFGGTASLAANTTTVLTTLAADAVPRAYYVNFANRAVVPATVRIAIAATDAPTDAEWIEFGGLARPGVPVRRWPLLVKASQRLVVRTDGSAVSATFWGRTYGAPIA